MRPEGGVYRDAEENGTCPVCGWKYLETDHIPENPDPDHEPHVPGTYYVHQWESIGNGKARLSGCSKYQNGETDAWDPR